MKRKKIEIENINQIDNKYSKQRVQFSKKIPFKIDCQIYINVTRFACRHKTRFKISSHKYGLQSERFYWKT